jgi:hypothetical protein
MRVAAKAFEFEIEIARIERVTQLSGTAGPVPESRACAGSKPHGRGGQPAYAPPLRAPQMPEPSCRRCFPAT